MISGNTIQLLILIFVMVFVFNCSKPVNETELLTASGDEYFSSYTTPSSSAGPNINIKDLFTLISDNDTGNDPYIIDWRSKEDYDKNHIKGAVNMALADLDDNLDSLPRDKMIVNVCYTGQTASFATAVINLAGEDEAYDGLEAQNLLFGMCSITSDPNIVPKSDKWVIQISEDEGYQIETSMNTVTKENGLPKLKTGEKTLEGIIKANLDDAVGSGAWMVEVDDLYANLNNYFVINYWPESEYLAGHIPGAYQFTPKVDLSSDKKLDLLPQDKPIAVYCYTGQTSAQVVAYLRLLGYDAKSVLFGVNGFAYNSLTKSKYSPVKGDDYLSILES